MKIYRKKFFSTRNPKITLKTKDKTIIFKFVGYRIRIGGV